MLSRRRFLLSTAASAPALALARPITAQAPAKDVLPAPILALKDRAHEATPITPRSANSASPMPASSWRRHKLAAITVTGGTHPAVLPRHPVAGASPSACSPGRFPASGAPFIICPTLKKAASTKPSRPHSQRQHNDDRLSPGTRTKTLTPSSPNLSKPQQPQHAAPRPRRARAVRLRRPHRAGRRPTHDHLRHPRRRRLPQHQEPGRTRAHAARQRHHLVRLQGRLRVLRARHDQPAVHRPRSTQPMPAAASTARPPATSRRSPQQPHGSPEAAGHPRKRHGPHRRRLHGRRLHFRHLPQLRLRQAFTDRQRGLRRTSTPQSAALAAAHPGVEMQAVDAAARNVIHPPPAIGPGYKHFTHRVGHGIGHRHARVALPRPRQHPDCSPPTWCFSDEPGIYLPDDPEPFGVRLEDDMVITESGAELFTPQSPSLQDPFAIATRNTEPTP